MKDFKEYSAVGTLLLVGIAALRLILFGEHYSFSAWSYISFSNIFAYTFDVIRGLIYYAPPVVFFFAYRESLTLRFLKLGFSVLLLGAITCFIIATCLYKMVPISFGNARLIRYLVLVSLFLGGMAVKKWDQIKSSSRSVLCDFAVVKFFLLIGFLYLYVKVDFRYTLYEVNRRKETARSMIVIKKGPNSFDTVRTTRKYYVILSTSDYVFLHNDTDSSTTAIPMVNVLSNTTNIVERACCTY